jgi:predicted metal-binding membrane protein
VATTTFFGASTLVFAASAALTIYWSASMSATGMPMPGGWTMSMAWMRMPGQTWVEAAASFLGMWIVMMIAMMMPSLAASLSRYREAVLAKRNTHAGLLTAIAGTAYFFVWTLFGTIAFPLGIALAEIEMRSAPLSRLVPIATVVVALIAASIQFSRWKARQLTCCREAPARARALNASAYAAWRYGIHLGLRCTYCCANLMVILLVMGVMDLRVMAVVTAAITLERLAPRPATTKAHVDSPAQV